MTLPKDEQERQKKKESMALDDAMEVSQNALDADAIAQPADAAGGTKDASSIAPAEVTAQDTAKSVTGGV